MQEWLRHVLRERRKNAGASLKDVEQAGAGVDRSTISRFERGQTGWPDNLDTMVTAYADVTGVSEPELWREALGLWEDELAGVAAATARRLKRRIAQSQTP
jgi:transcriptional regulator with XRE-family HTH domain